ncbi:SH3 domain-containing protein [Saccharopolyspora sp. NPDC002686]|uniref:SH3 domain-containing protein n=1 Tax=Saccharopolyspora sp. NPDC002686 TaxID=3154541 RepID=UPI003326DC72
MLTGAPGSRCRAAALKLGLPRPTRRFAVFFVPRSLLLIGAGAIGALYLTSTHEVGSAPDPPQHCSFHVAADVLNVRSGPGPAEHQVDTLRQGDQVNALPNVVDGFRDLGDGRWAAQQYLLPAPGSACAP